MHPIDPSSTNLLIETRNKFVKMFAESNQYGFLTQPYIQKSFTIFNLLISSSIETDDMSSVPLIALNTQNELIETQLNIKYLLLTESMCDSESNYDFSRYEIDLIEFFKRNHTSRVNILRVLPSIKDLYHIIEHPKQFYPFGVIRAYEILSILIVSKDAFERHHELKRLTFSDLEELMIQASEEEGVDDVADSMWKYISAHLNHCQVHPSQVTTKQISNVLTHLRHITQCYKSINLRQTATEVLATIIQYFKENSNMDILIDFAELILSLLRDDDVYVRNRTSDIVMELIADGDGESRFDRGKTMKKVNINRFFLS